MPGAVPVCGSPGRRIQKELTLIRTVGHSTRSAAEFIALLRAHGIDHLVDIRTVPRSRRNPQFDRSALPETLQEAGIRYTHLAELGGLRHTRQDSINTAWRNESFRGYADYMQTNEFRTALGRLIEMARSERIAVMCAEAVPWRCHCSLLSDALVARGIRVEHILSAAPAQPHAITPFARVEGECVTYPGEA